MRQQANFSARRPALALVLVLGLGACTSDDDSSDSLDDGADVSDGSTSSYELTINDCYFYESPANELGDRCDLGCGSDTYTCWYYYEGQTQGICVPTAQLDACLQ